MIDWITNNGKVYKNLEDAHHLAGKDTYKSTLYILTQNGRFRVTVDKCKLIGEREPHKTYTHYFLVPQSEVDFEGNDIETKVIWKKYEK